MLFGYLAAVTSLELVTGIIILPQRQTALVAKQAAEVDLLTGGRFRLGVGIGWNAVEYEALGKTFTDRGRRIEEQIALLRRLWTEPTVTHDGEYEHVTGAGLAPLPVQRPIPIWIGGRRPRPTGAPAGWPTAGSRRSRPGPSSTRPRRSSTRPRATPGATRRRSAWRAGSAGPTPASTSSSTTSAGGGAGATHLASTR